MKWFSLTTLQKYADVAKRKKTSAKQQEGGAKKSEPKAAAEGDELPVRPDGIPDIELQPLVQPIAFLGGRQDVY